MSLLDGARRVAAEFDYPTENVNRGVKEFIKQMGRRKLSRMDEIGGCTHFALNHR